MGTIRHQTPAKTVLGGLLKPLFRQFQCEVRRMLLPRTNVNRMLAIHLLAIHRTFHEEPPKIGHLGYSAPPLNLLEFLSNVYRKSMK